MPKKRFLDYLLNKLPFIFLSIGLILLGLTYYRTVLIEFNYYLDNILGKKHTLSRNVTLPSNDNNFRNLSLSSSDLLISPIDKGFGIVIEKINVNAPVVKDVPVINHEAYLEALKWGVAHASFSGYPNEQNSNVYLFAHSSNNFWELGKYSTVFNLLYKLGTGDQINIFYEGKRYLYQVDNKLLLNDFKVDETIYDSIGPTLTLQTCYPTGTSLYRLVIRASLVGIYEN